MEVTYSSDFASLSRTSSVDGDMPDLHDVESIGGNSRAGSPLPVEEKSVTTEGGHSMSSASSSAGPEAKIKFDIRAHSIIAHDSFQKTVTEQRACRDEVNAAKQIFEATPVYEFKTRATLHKAALKAELKFNLSKADTHFRQVQIDYLDALSKSGLPPDIQHKKYSQFQEAVKEAHTERIYADSFEGNTMLASRAMRNSYAPDIQRIKNTAFKAEQVVHKLLKEVQQPHLELRNNLATNLKHREVQLRDSADKNSLEALTLQKDIATTRAFLKEGGLDSLTPPEAATLNRLFDYAAIKYNTWKKEPAEEPQKPIPNHDLGENAIEMTAFNKPLSRKEIYEQDFKAADALVMEQIRLLGSRLKGPPKVRKDLVVMLRHKESLRGNNNNRTLVDHDIDTLKAFLDSPELDALSQDSADHLTNLFQTANSRYNTYYHLSTAAQIAEEEVTQAKAEPPAPRGKDISTAPTKEETAQAEAKQKKIETLVLKAKEARKDLLTAKEALKEADAILMDEIRNLYDGLLPASASMPIASSVEEDIEVDEVLLKPQPKPLAPPGRVNSSSSAASAAGSLSTPPTAEELASLKAFAERTHKAVDDRIKSLTIGKSSPKEAEYKKQLLSLTKLIELLDDSNPSAEKIKSLKPLVVRMKEIEGKNEERDAARTENPTAVPSIIEARTKLENTFLAQLQELFSPT
jgi:hypothetical protein